MSDIYPNQRSPRFSAAELSYSQVKQMIVNGQLAPGTILSENELAKTLGLSRTPLRQALERLQSERFIYRLPNGRIKVTSLSAAEAEDLFRVRMAMECLVVEEAARNLKPEWAQKLRELAYKITVIAATGLGQELSQLGEEFHYTLVAIASNSYAAWVLSQLRDHIKRYRSIGPNQSPTRRAQAAQEHVKIIELMLSGKTEEARAVMRQHVENSLNTLLIYIKQNLNTK